MGRAGITLEDRIDLSKSLVMLNGNQALVRLMLAQKARDAAAGLRTAGYVTGYRGSPLGAVDMQMTRARPLLEAADIRFHPALNEDLAATAMAGAQAAALRGEGRVDGVFGLWYGKGPGVDRSGDAFRHGNMAGTAAQGGVLVAMGDDHTGESSTTCHQSDLALIDAGMPILSPAGVQEILDYGHYGFSLSRFAGVWVGLKAVKDAAEATALIEGDPHRVRPVLPEFEMPEGGLNIRLGDHWVAQEERLLAHKLRAAEALARANRLDRRVHGAKGARIGVVAAGKNWLDVMSALSALGIDASARAEALGLTSYKVAQIWPLDGQSLRDWAEGLDLVICVEEKRKIIEPQIKEALFDSPTRPRVWGHRRGQGGAVLFQTHYGLDSMDVAEALGDIVISEGYGDADLQAALDDLRAASVVEDSEDGVMRTPYFCAGCPHNRSTKLPKGARGGAGIGCHFMAKWMDRNTEAYTQMGGEGANWIGEAPFSTRPHIFQNIGEGTYNHSGLMAMRGAVGSGANITYKVLFNDAVAMTGGQGNDGDLDPARVTHELQAAGVTPIALVYDPSEVIERAAFPKGVEWHPRDDLMSLQERFQTIPGTSAIVYVQTCAAEKRRRRKRGQFPDPDKRVFINPDICEGCGDCGVQSNCVAIAPLETELGRKRIIDQSSCNKDFSCIDGFCPSFVTIEGGTPRQDAATLPDLSDLPKPALPQIEGTHNVLITGVGGTGAVTIGALLAQAAQLDGLAAAMIEMAGLAQKGGAVTIHLRLAHAPQEIGAIRLGLGEADAVLGGDLVVTAERRARAMMRPGRTSAVVNSHEMVTGSFTRAPDFAIPGRDLRLALSARLGGRLQMMDATAIARVGLGDTLFANMVVLGAAWQRGLIPLSRGAICGAIELNGASVPENLKAFELGRWASLQPEDAHAFGLGAAAQLPETLEEKIAHRAAHLALYQNERLARRYRVLVDGVADRALREAVALGYHKLLSYKDEYEVARLHVLTEAKARAAFAGDLRLRYHLAPPLLPGRDAAGRPRKRAFGPWIAWLFPALARIKVLRGTALDPFGYTTERRMERRLIRDYERDLARWLADPSSERHAALIALAELPLSIKGFGPVKARNAQAAAKRRAEIIAMLEAGGATVAQAAE